MRQSGGARGGAGATKVAGMTFEELGKCHCTTSKVVFLYFQYCPKREPLLTAFLGIPLEMFYEYIYTHVYIDIYIRACICMNIVFLHKQEYTSHTTLPCLALFT